MPIRLESQSPIEQSKWLITCAERIEHMIHLYPFLFWGEGMGLFEQPSALLRDASLHL